MPIDIDTEALRQGVLPVDSPEVSSDPALVYAVHNIETYRRYPQGKVKIGDDATKGKPTYLRFRNVRQPTGTPERKLPPVPAKPHCFTESKGAEQEVKSLHSEQGIGGQGGKARRNQPAQGHTNPDRQSEIARQHGAGVAPDAHNDHVAQGKLPGGSQEPVAYRNNDIDDNQD